MVDIISFCEDLARNNLLTLHSLTDNSYTTTNFGKAHGELFATPECTRKNAIKKTILTFKRLGCVSGFWAKLFVLLGRLLVMKRPCDRYCITSSWPPGANKLVNDYCGKNLWYVAARSHMRRALTSAAAGDVLQTRPAVTLAAAREVLTCGHQLTSSARDDPKCIQQLL